MEVGFDPSLYFGHALLAEPGVAQHHDHGLQRQAGLTTCNRLPRAIHNQASDLGQFTYRDYLNHSRVPARYPAFDLILLYYSRGCIKDYRAIVS